MTADDRYRVDNSAAVTAEFRQVVATAEARGQLALAVRAARWLVDELAYDPHAFGEGRYFGAAAGIAIRVGFVRPFYVEFGIHDPSRTVYLRKFRYAKP